MEEQSYYINEIVINNENIYFETVSYLFGNEQRKMSTAAWSILWGARGGSIITVFETGLCVNFFML